MNRLGSNIAYVNGAYVPLHQARIAMQDRGYHFADGCYEVVMFYNRRFLDWPRHNARLHYSLNALRIAPPMSDDALYLVISNIMQRNPYSNGYVYLQVTRGVARRNHMFPDMVPVPSLTMQVTASRRPCHDALMRGVYVITTDDMRWKRCDIKSIALLPNVLALQEAKEAGAQEAFMFNDHGYLTECGRSTAYIIVGNTVVTHPENEAVLPGVRKQVLRDICKAHHIPYQERMISREEVMQADEALLSSATNGIMPVTRIDDMIIGDGSAGPLSRRLVQLYHTHIQQQTG